MKCGSPLSPADEYTIIPHAADLNFPLFDLELTPDETAITKSLVITGSQEVPAGYQTAGLVFAESAVPQNAEMKAAWQDLMKHLYGLMLNRGYAGVFRVEIKPEPTNPGQLCLYGEALVKEMFN
ncbi:hypothetical protein OXT66_01210 [Lentilactobacillus senioris]|uniref:hypothetical protein n=1 Tax=Lentilactobacillus senioris TaxID=931534 RepID=UPI00227ECB94|nr:hypothetical protein [Lentilactobacillus senioris]MCY9806164.1 hypothetical protein [Lentilactobacillus senioris]